MVGSAQADEVEGGLGSDYCRAYEGDDTYSYHLSDGFDIWEDNQGLNTVRLGEGITPDMLTFLLYNIATTSLSKVPEPKQQGEDLGILIEQGKPNESFILINNWIYNTLNWRIEFTAIDPDTGKVYSAIERTELDRKIASWDRDKDSIPDWWELLHGLDPTVSNQGTDTDGDRLLDVEEFNAGSNPNKTDTDGDLLNDYSEVFITRTDPTVKDNFREVDLDGDGLSVEEEIDIGSDPLVFDTNGDGISDGVTYALGLDPTAPDPDGDGLTKEQENRLGTSNVHSDTDGDGFSDAIDPNPTNADVFLTMTDGDTTAPAIVLILPTPN